MPFIEERRPGSAWSTSGATTGVSVDQGLRSHMLAIYNWMASGLALTGVVALLVAHNPSIAAMFYTIGRTASGHMATQPTLLGWLAILSPLAFVLVMSFGINRLSRSTITALFWAFCGAMGISMANVFVIYTGASIASAFFVSAGMFAGASLYGYTTGADLSRMGSFMMMGLIGMILAGLVNMVLQSTMLQFVLSVVGVVVFVGLTAWDTQRIKSDYLSGTYSGDPEMGAKMNVMAALNLYLNFVNLFQLMLQLTGVRRSD